MATTTTTSEKSPVAVLLLCIFLGGLGVHRFYVGKIGTGILMLLTGGGLGIWYMIDIALIVCNKFTDKNGNIIELSQKPPSFKKVMIVFGILMALFYGFLISAIVAVLIATSGLVKVADDQLSALRANDIEKAYSYTSTDFKKATSLNDFTRLVNQLKLETNESASFLERKIVNGVGDIKGTLKLKDGTTFSIEYRLNKEDEQWKINSLELHSSTQKK